MVITASGFQQKIEDSAASISVVTREQLEKRAYRDVTDALKDVPGVVITGGGSSSDISIRGMGAKYTLMLVDGKRVDSRGTRPNSDGPGIEQGWLPPLQAIGWQRDPAWRGMLVAMLDHVAGAGVPEPAAKVCAQLKRLAHEDSAALETMADAVLAERDGEVDSAMAPFVMAALQVYWTDLAGRFDERQLPVVSPFGVCPVCASLPVASVVRIGGQRDGCRYLCCSLCSTQWHLVRVTCSHCEQTEGIAYHSIEGGPEGIKAESCDHCHTYRKIFYHEKDQYFEAVADDLATLPLDVLMGEEGYSRASANPLLWQHP